MYFMPGNARIKFCILFILVLGLFLPTRGRGAEPKPITIFAASSLKELITKISDRWSTQQNRKIRLQFEASSTLARQIAAGAPADLFITASPEWLADITTHDRYDWLSNRLVVIAPSHIAAVNLRTVRSMALASAEVPAGKYARAALAYETIPLPKRVIEGANVRDVLSKVLHGGAEVGIVYATDASLARSGEIKIVHTFAEAAHPKIIYSVGLLTENGREMFVALRDATAISAAKRLGFIELSP